MKKDMYFGPSIDSASQRDLLYSTLESEIARLNLPFSEINQGIAKKAAGSLYNVDYMSRKEFVDSYKQGRLKHEIAKAKGNLTQVTRNLYGVDDPSRINVLRKNVDDAVKNFDLRDYVDMHRPWKPVQKHDSYVPVPKERVVDALSSGLSQYQSVIHPDVYNQTKQKILEYAPDIAKAVAPYVPSRESTIDYLVRKTEGMTWDDSVKFVEKIAVKEALKNAGDDKKKAADYLGNSVKTVNRKIKQFRLADKVRRLTLEKDSKVPKVLDSGEGSDISKIPDVSKKKERPRSQAEYFRTVAAEYDLAA